MQSSIIGGISVLLEECGLVCTVEPKYVKARPFGRDIDSFLFVLESPYLSISLLNWNPKRKKPGQFNPSIFFSSERIGPTRPDLISMVDLRRPGFSEKIRRVVHHNLDHQPKEQDGVRWSLEPADDIWTTISLPKEDQARSLITWRPTIARIPGKIKLTEFLSKLPYVVSSASTGPSIRLGRESEASRLQRHLPVGGCHCFVCCVLAVQSSLEQRERESRIRTVLSF